MATNANDVAKTLDSIGTVSFASDADRYEALEAARRLVARLTTPFEHYITLSGSIPSLVAGIQIFQDLKIWSIWRGKFQEHGNVSQTLSDIVTMCDVPVEPSLIRRIAIHLAALHVLEETGVDEWKPTPFTLTLGDATSPVPKAFALMVQTTPAALNIPSFLAKNGYREPLDQAQGDIFADTFGATFFEYCKDDDGVAQGFAGIMTSVGEYKGDWTEVYDTDELVSGADFTEPLFVDIGGMHGLDTVRLLSKRPDIPASARLVVQDLPEVVSSHAKKDAGQLDPRISRMAYDFFTPQPLVGARAYFFHAVAHDWPDAECVRIFENVKAVMKKGYSKLLIYEIVIPPKGATPLMTTMDLALMYMVSGLERTEERWKALLSGVGLRVVSISRHPRAVESVIEAELP